MNMDIRTKAIPSWCPGCNNFLVLKAVEDVIKQKIQEGKKKEDFAIVTGIGCHGKIFDYLNLGGINALHGRVVPTCLGIKLAKPDLIVMGFAGDGGAYAEGIEHLVHASRYNPGFVYVVLNNQTFALTLGQAAPTTSPDFYDKTGNDKVRIIPLNPIKLALSAGCGFVARVSTDISEMKEVLNEAIKHKGFSFVEVLEPCLMFNQSLSNQKFYNLQKAGHNKSDIKSAFEKADEFDYASYGKEIPTGIFYQKERETFEEIKWQK